MDQTTMGTIPAQPKLRRRFRFTLRASMFLVLSFAAWLGWRVHLARTQRQVVAAIRAFGGYVGYDWEWERDRLKRGAAPKAPAWLRRAIGDEYFQEVVEVNLIFSYRDFRHFESNARITDDLVPELAKLRNLKWLHMYKSQPTDRAMETVGRLVTLEKLVMYSPSLTDAGIAKLRSLVRLKEISVQEANLTDESLKYLAALPQLEVMCLQGNRFTDEGLAYLSGMTRLKEFFPDMGGPGVTDKGLVHLKGLTSLETLWLQKSAISDAGLEALVGLKNLRELFLQGTRVTPEGVEQLKTQTSIVSLRGPREEFVWMER